MQLFTIIIKYKKQQDVIKHFKIKIQIEKKKDLILKHFIEHK